MPLVTLEQFDLQGKSPQELEQRRQGIEKELEKFSEGMDDPDVDIKLLQELSLITGVLRRARTSAPVRASASKKEPKKVATLADLENML